MDYLKARIQDDLKAIQTEFAHRVSSEQVEAIANRRLDLLRSTATITDFIPLLVVRQTRDELLASELDGLDQAAPTSHDAPALRVIEAGEGQTDELEAAA